MRRLGLSLLFVAAALSVGAGSASGLVSGPQPSCGDTITVSTTLVADLVNCPNNGIVIGADNITLDLNGHVIEATMRSSATARPTSSATSALSISTTTG